MLSGRRRRGATLAELLVALVLAAIVLATATSTFLHQQRTSGSLRRVAREDAQLRAALGPLGMELGALTAGSDDLAPGQASDTAVQLRSLIATGLACDDAVGSATFVGERDEDGEALGGAAPRVGDTVWWYGGQPAGWRGRRIVASDSVGVGCLLASRPWGPARRILIADPDTIGYGAPLRITRPVRYGFYRSGDGSWQLGVREWVAGTGGFAAPQPIAGPFLMRADGMRTGFRYYDVDGGELGIGGAAVESGRVARVRITVIGGGPTSDADRGAMAPRDSADVALQVAGVP